MYSVMEVAKYVIDLCYRKGIPVSNLKLQKLLYFAWIEFYRKTGKYLFCDEICAWPLGPVVPKAYYEYCCYGGIPIQPGYNCVRIVDKDKKILDVVLSSYVKKSSFELVNITHREDSVWCKVYDRGNGNKKVIPFRMIIDNIKD